MSLSLSVCLSVPICLSVSVSMPISFWAHLAPWSGSTQLHHNLLPAPTPPGQPFDPSLLLAQATSNVACSLTFGLRFPYENKEFQAVVRAASGVLLGTSSPWGQVSEWGPSPAIFSKDSCLPLPGNPQSTPSTCPCALMQGQAPMRTAAFSHRPTRCFPGSCGPFQAPVHSSSATWAPWPPLPLNRCSGTGRVWTPQALHAMLWIPSC